MAEGEQKLEHQGITQRKAKRAVAAVLTRSQEGISSEDLNLSIEERAENQLAELCQNGLNGILADQMGLFVKDHFLWKMQNEEDMLAMLRDEEDTQDKKIQSVISEEDLEKVLDRSELVATNPAKADALGERRFCEFNVVNIFGIDMPPEITISGKINIVVRSVFS
ncbi:hypothetical protein Ccrd_005631 [Cynara cardunculus var. scolymus]|uniref:Uncharacterized protein n=1 Tax=Cynara cardunculus var. scolymus TaxID=59895 RepID=A0A103XKC2_CYNCS|nr:hypothetical protein Ccrd_005631 [Cynara cardunculus var. scolymus]